ncbi:MAG: tetratricopeptide repeat protein [Candidatus Eisenbacteria bacterium]
MLRQWCEKTDDWSTANGPQSVWLMTGEGGAGKTRLFIEWCRRIRLEGWVAGFVPRETRPEDAAALTAGRHRRFLVIDYAESSSELVRAILSSLADQRDRKQTTPIVRLVLLSREVSDWWRSLNEPGESNRSIHDLLADSPKPSEIRTLGRSEEDRRRLFESASDAFARFSGLTPPARTTREFADEHFRRPLYLHMAALAAVEGKVLTSASELLEWTYGRERKMWFQALAVVHSTQDAQQEELKRVVPLAVLAITLVGGVGTRAAARDLITRAIPSEETQPYSANSVIRALHELYGGVADGAPYLASLTPDLLAEYAVTQEVRRLGDDAPRFLKSLFDGADVGAVNSTLTILARLSPEELPLEQWIEAVLSEHFIERAPVALDAALAVGKRTAESPLGLVLARRLGEAGTLELAIAFWGRVPQDTVGLREVGLWITAELLGSSRGALSTSAALRAVALVDHGIRLGAVGRREDALEATKEATELYRRLATQRPDAFLPYLATSLNNLGNVLSELGRREDALEATKEATELDRRLATQRPDAFLPELAMSLNNLGNRLSELGRREDALEATKEATELYRRLATQRPDAFGVRLAGSLASMGLRLRELERNDEALSAVREAVIVITPFVERYREAHGRWGAMMLRQYLETCEALGREPDADILLPMAVALGMSPKAE